MKESGDRSNIGGFGEGERTGGQILDDLGI
jgi:hypothetical protein